MPSAGKHVTGAKRGKACNVSIGKLREPYHDLFCFCTYLETGIEVKPNLVNIVMIILESDEKSAQI